MRRPFRGLWLAAALALIPAPATSAPLSEADRQALDELQRTYVQGWLRNDREQVMSVMARDSVFIPHDGVQPRAGFDTISEFWFPRGQAVGRVPAYDQTVTRISGDDHNAVIYGRFDLHYEASGSHYNWIGNYLIVARKDEGRWLVTHMMANDADPTITPVTAAATGQ